MEDEQVGCYRFRAQLDKRRSAQYSQESVCGRCYEACSKEQRRQLSKYEGDHEIPAGKFSDQSADFLTQSGHAESRYNNACRSACC